MKTRTVYYCSECDNQVALYDDGSPMTCEEHEEADTYNTEEEIEYVTDYSKMSNEDFQRCLLEVLEEYTPQDILFLPGVYEVVSEHLNNDVLDLWDQQEQDKYNNEEE